MLIYIIHSDRIFKFRLPNKVSGSYILKDVDLKGVNRNLINVSANATKWIISSSGDTKIIQNNSIIPSIELIQYRFYQLLVNNSENVLLYITPSNDHNYLPKQLVNKDSSSKVSVILGSGSQCDIICTNYGLGEKQFELIREKGIWFFRNLNTKIPIYVSNLRKDSSKLHNFDLIFCNGIKILICGNILLFSDPFNRIVFSTPIIINAPFEMLIEKTVNKNNNLSEFYDKNEYYYKSPIFRKKISTYEFEILPPNPKELKDSSSLLMSVIPSGLMGISTIVSTYYTIRNYKSGESNRETLITSLIMCVVMLITSVLWPFIEKFASTIRRFVVNRARVFTYHKYLKRKRKELDLAINEQKMALEFNNVSNEECYEAVKKKTSLLFSRNYGQDLFLCVRLGKGEVPFDSSCSYKKIESIENTEKLLDDLEKTLREYRVIKDAPFSFSFFNKNVAFINELGNYSNFMESIFLQLLCLHDYHSLKLVVLSSGFSSVLDNLKLTRHCWNEDESFRYYANNIHDAEKISSELVRIYNRRVDNTDEHQKLSALPYYLIISDDINIYRNLKIVDNVLNSAKNSNFSLLVFVRKIAEAPDECRTFVNFNDVEGTVFNSEMEEKNTLTFKPSYLNNINFEEFILNISDIPVSSVTDKVSSLPDKIGFLEMYGVGNVLQLNSLERWKNPSIINSLSVPVGIDSSHNLVSLDLHEKYHGPHGLVAGMTGSGKSEFIVTYILSLAVNYSPNEVQFVLIDYKGGGLAGAFENRKTGIKLPHLVGTITNLDKSSMNRTLVSIQSELHRRQKVFNQAKEQLNIATIDIYKYQKLVREGSLKEPLSHLFIISDEFAELKDQQPDFMDQLVSAARIGRSLGVHLILATQKPSGVVDDQIWSNSKFKVCCKVQTSDDSNDMINRPDAAYIKESGRFYLQVGYDEIFVLGQSAYTGTQYKPTDSVSVSLSDSIEFLDNTGNVVITTKKETKKEEITDLGEELGNVLKYVIDCAKTIDFKNRQLWLDNVPDFLTYSSLVQKYPFKADKYYMKPLIGEYDDPAHQKQGPVFLDITSKGNTWISGMYGSGKTTLLSTIIYSLMITHSSQEFNVFILDLLAESLKVFSKAPQVAEFISSGDIESINKLFHYIEREIEHRRRYYADNGGSFNASIANGTAIFPTIIIIINGMDIFMEDFSDIYDQLFLSLIRDCNRFGIIFIITSTGFISSQIDRCFSSKIALRYLDTSEYETLFTNSKKLVPKSNPGRGLIELDEVYEFQSSIIAPIDKLEDYISYAVSQITKVMPKARGIPKMPQIVTYEYISNYIGTLSSVPVGVELDSNCIFTYDFTEIINIIIYTDQNNLVSFENGLLKIISSLNNVKVITLDGTGLVQQIEGVQVYNSNFIKIVKSLYLTIKKKFSTDPLSEKIVFVFSDYQKINNYLNKCKKEDNTVKTLDDLLMVSIGAENYKFIISLQSDYNEFNAKGWADYVNLTNGILLNTPPDSQTILDVDSAYEEIKYRKDTSIVVKETKRVFIKNIRGV